MNCLRNSGNHLIQRLAGINQFDPIRVGLVQAKVGGPHRLVEGQLFLIQPSLVRTSRKSDSCLGHQKFSCGNVGGDVIDNHGVGRTQLK